MTVVDQETDLPGDRGPGRLGRRWLRLRRSRNLKRFLRNPSGIVALVVLAVLVLVGVLHGALEPVDPTLQVLADRMQGPTGAHLLGTDDLGRDELSRLLAATAITLEAAVIGTLVALLGTPVGLLAGYVGGLTDATISRIFDALIAIPPLLLAFGIVGFLGSGLGNAMLAVGIVLAPRFFRVGQAAARTIRTETYIESSRAIGCSTWRILLRHVLPNASGPMLVQTSFTIGLVIGVESGLSFLGLGVQPPAVSWGGMLHDAFLVANQDPWLLIPPTATITVAILAAFVLGDAIHDAVRRSSED